MLHKKKCIIFNEFTNNKKYKVTHGNIYLLRVFPLRRVMPFSCLIPPPPFDLVF